MYSNLFEVFISFFCVKGTVRIEYDSENFDAGVEYKAGVYNSYIFTFYFSF